MKNGIAAVQFGDQISLFEYSGGDYVPARVAAPIRHPGGLAISGNSVLIGGNNCDYDAVIYQKSTDSSWPITGRIDDNTGSECDVWGTEVELNYDYALLRPHYGGVTTAWRRNGTALDWVPAGALNLPPDTRQSVSPYALQGATAVANNGVRLAPQRQQHLDSAGRGHERGPRQRFRRHLRRGVSRWRAGDLRVPSIGQFCVPIWKHHPVSSSTSPVCRRPTNAWLHDISGRTVVAVARDSYAHTMGRGGLHTAHAAARPAAHRQ